MALTQLDLGSSPNDGTGTTLRAGGALINLAMTQIDTNETDIGTNDTDIGTNETDIAANTALIAVIQSKSFISPSTSSISNTSNTVYVATDLLVAITPKSASSVLRVSFLAPMSTASSQTGAKIKVQSNIDSAGWNDVVFGNQVDTLQFRDAAGSPVNFRISGHGMTQIDSPGISDEVEFRVMFAGFTDTFNVDYVHNQGMRMITVDEILE